MTLLIWKVGDLQIVLDLGKIILEEGTPLSSSRQLVLFLPQRAVGCIPDSIIHIPIGHLKSQVEHGFSPQMVNFVWYSTPFIEINILKLIPYKIRRHCPYHLFRPCPCGIQI